MVTLTKEQFLEVMTIAGRFHTTKISLNMPVNNFVGIWVIQSTECTLRNAVQG